MVQFPGVIGQQHLQQQLVAMVENNRLGHALLMVGKEGAGVLPLAIAFGQYVVSQRAAKAPVMVADLFGGMSALPQEPATDEDEQPDTFDGFDKKALDLVHPDLHFSYPVIKRDGGGDSAPVSADYGTEWRKFLQTNPYGNLYDWLQFIKADNKQGNISVREVENIIHKLNLKPYESRYKVLVMWMPEMLGNVGNKLLKLIEEPPANTLFILAAENEDRVLSTIVSRCQLIRVPPLSNADVAAALEQRNGLSADKAMQVAMVSGGSYREAQLLQCHHDESWNNLLRDWLNATMLRTTAGGNAYQDLNKLVGEMAALGREKQKQLLQYFLELINQSLRIRLVGIDNLNLPPEEAAFAMKLNKAAGPSTLAAMASILEQSYYYIERNANAKILFHAMSVRMRHALLEKTYTSAV